MGWIFVENQYLDQVLERSFTQGATFWRQGFDDTTFAISLRRNTTVKDAKESARKFSGLSRGVIYDSNTGQLKIRVPKDEESINQAKAVMDPALAELVGKEMMTLAENNGNK